MIYINDVDRDYILNKYHLLSKPYDIMNRFVRNDVIFDPSTGMDGDEIIKELKKSGRKERFASPPHPQGARPTLRTGKYPYLLRSP